MQLSPGDRVSSYEIVGVLGAGGMGSVYRARDSRLGRDIAIKVLQERLLTSREHLSRFEQEARSASALNHPNIVTIYDIGQIDSTPFIAMEFIDGSRLRDLVKDAPLSMRKLLHIATQIAEGLAGAHERGIVHRDLKPENVMITRDGLVKIVDFGLARLRIEPSTDEASTSELISSGGSQSAVMGTAAYMSPEQASGQKVDFRSDQFSLGSILYEMAAGRRPFARASTLDTLSAIVHDEPDPVERFNPKVPQPLRWTIQRCLAKDPRDRYASTRDLARDLQTIRDHLTETTTGEPVRKIELPPRRRRIALAIAGIVVAALVSAAVLMLGPRTPLTPPRNTASLPAHMSLAVLPFEDLSGVPNGDLLGRGFAETVSAGLQQAGALQVIPPAQSLKLLAEKADLARLARELGANMILRATIQRAGEDLRVNFSILEPKGVQLGANTITGSVANYFSLQDELVDSVFSELGLRGPQPAERDRELITADDQERYLEALAHLQRYQNEQEVDQAVQILSGLAAKLPKSALVQAALGRAYLSKYKVTDDPVWSGKVIEASDRARQIDSTLPEVHLTLGETKLLTGHAAEAAEEFRRVLAYQPNSSEATLGLAEALQQSGKPDEAEKTYRRGIELRPDWWASYNRLGAFYFTRGDYQGARQMFAQAVRLTPDNARSHSNLGGAQFMLGEFDAALQSYSKALQMGPDASALHNTGYCYYYLGRFADAAASFRKAIEIRPKSSLYWANLGDAYRALGDRVQQRSAYRKAIELASDDIKLNPNNAAAHGTLARCYAKTGDFSSARKHIDAALKLQPQNPDRMVQAAMVANLSGNEKDASWWLQRAFAAGYLRTLAEREPDFANLKRKNLLDSTS